MFRSFRDFYWEGGWGTEKDQICFKGDSSGSKMKDAFERGGTGQSSLGPELGKQKYEVLIQEIFHDLVTVWPWEVTAGVKDDKVV